MGIMLHNCLFLRHIKNFKISTLFSFREWPLALLLSVQEGWWKCRCLPGTSPKGNETGSSSRWTFLTSFLAICMFSLEHSIDWKAQPYIISFLYQVGGRIARSGFRGVLCVFVCSTCHWPSFLKLFLGFDIFFLDVRLTLLTIVPQSFLINLLPAVP